MKHLLSLAVTAALVLIAGSGCTTETHINYYGVHPDSVIHDTVYVQETHEIPDTQLGNSGIETGEEEPSGRVVSLLRLDPGTATVEQVIDYDQGIIRNRMLNNILDGEGFRFELNCMSEYLQDAISDEYYLVAIFDSNRDWSEPIVGPQPISDPSITLSVNGEETRFYSTGFTVESAEPLAIGSYQITLLIPVELDLLRNLANGTRAHLLLRDRGSRQSRDFSVGNFVNFNSFMESFVF